MQIRLPTLKLTQLTMLFLALLFFKEPIRSFRSAINYFKANSPSELWLQARSADAVAGTADFGIIVAALRQHSIKNYRIVGELKDDPYFYQRVIEGGWPIRYRPGSDFVVGRLAEIDAACRLLTGVHTTSYGEIGLAHCRHLHTAP